MQSILTAAVPIRMNNHWKFSTVAIFQWSFRERIEAWAASPVWKPWDKSVPRATLHNASSVFYWAINRVSWFCPPDCSVHMYGQLPEKRKSCVFANLRFLIHGIELDGRLHINSATSANSIYFTRACKVPVVGEYEFLWNRSACGLPEQDGSSLASLDFIGEYTPHFVRRDLFGEYSFLPIRYITEKI